MQKLYRYKGKVANLEELQQKTDKVLGDVYYVESENSDYYWNKLEWVDVGNRADLTDLATKTELNKMQTDLQYGTHIREGQDLNDITQVGLYHSTNGATTNTLINCPIRDNGFRLEVITINIPNRLLQIINVNARDEIWIRRLNTLIASEDNGEWQKIAITKEVNEAKFDKVGKVLTDCNDVSLDSGIYYTENTTLNKPTEQSGSAGFLIVIKKQWNVNNSNAVITQYWLRYRDRQVYERQRSGITNFEFSEWEEVTGRYLKKTGGTLTGNVTIENDTDSWKSMGVERTINGIKYIAKLGVGANKGLALTIDDATNNKNLNRIEVGADGKLRRAATQKEYPEMQTKNIANHTGQILLGNILIQFGSVLIKPVANTPTKATITFPYKYKNLPNVQVSPWSGVIGTTVLGAAMSDPTVSKVDIYVTRTNTSDTAIHWFAIGLADDTVTKL